MTDDQLKDKVIDILKYTKVERMERDMALQMARYIREVIDSEILKELNRQYDDERWHKEND
jgi:hypothetical protein